MWFYAILVVFFIFPNQCFCGLRQEVETWSKNGNSEGLKCFETVAQSTNWSGNEFSVISEDMSMVRISFFEQCKMFKRGLHSVKNSTITDYTNVIIFTKNFYSLSQILSTVDTKRIDTRVKFVINIEKNFDSLNEIRNASYGIPELMWNLDKTRVLFLVPCKENIFAMTYFPFAVNCKPGELEVLNVWREGGFEKEVDLFAEKMLDIRGCVQNVSSIFEDSLKLQGFKEYTENGEAVLGGVGGRLSYMVAEKMNMKLYLIPEEPESWFKLLDQVREGESLFSVIGNIPNSKYLATLDQDGGFMQESFGFGYLTGGLEISWKNFIWPMTSRVWEWTGYTFLFFCSVVFLANFVHRQRGSSAQLEFLDVFGIFLGGSRSLPRGIFSRYLFAIWILYSYLIIAAYNSGLVSFLTTPNEKGVINTLEELLADGLEFGGGDFHKEFYHDPTDPVMMKIYKNFKILSTEESTRLLFEGKCATGTITSMLVTYNKEHSGDGDNRLRMLEDKAFIFHLPITMRRGSPFIIGVRRYTWRAIQAGFVQYWLNHYIGTSTSEKIRTKPPTVITKQHLRGILYLHAVGLFFSSLVFIGELIYHKRFTNRGIRRSFIVV